MVHDLLDNKEMTSPAAMCFYESRLTKYYATSNHIGQILRGGEVYIVCCLMRQARLGRLADERRRAFLCTFPMNNLTA